MFRRRGLLGILLGFFFGSAFMTFLGKKKGKDLRREVLNEWENGENPVKAKMGVYLRELKDAFGETGSAVKEFADSPKAQEIVKKAKKGVRDTVQKSKKAVGEKVTDIKKKAAEKIRSAIQNTEE